MIANRNYGHCEPLTWIGRFPVYLATVLAGVQAVSMVLTALILAAQGPLGPILAALTFSYDTFIGLRLWQAVSYVLVNPPDFFFVFQLFFFAWFGAEVEKFLGRKSFAWLCALLVLATPALLCLLGALGVRGSFAGAGTVNLAVFFTFAMIYPRAEIFFNIEARWIALILAVVNSLIFLAAQAWIQLGALWWGVGVAALWLRFEGAGGLSLGAVQGFLARRHSQRALKVVKPEKADDAVNVSESIDPILEKIARQGIGSLSRGERDKLERARAALLEKERRH